MQDGASSPRSFIDQDDRVRLSLVGPHATLQVATRGYSRLPRLTSAAGAAINTMKSPASRTRFLSRLPSVLALALLTETIKGEKSTVLRSSTYAKCKSCAMPDLREECKPRPQRRHNGHFLLNASPLAPGNRVRASPSRRHRIPQGATQRIICGGLLPRQLVPQGGTLSSGRAVPPK